MNSEKKARVIAFYLPQYHPTPENDKYWGKGFTEWTNVAKSRPLFKGHYQPKIPADLGFYDLRLPVIREQQAQLAKAAGVEAFMYWHYWFGNGVMTLQDIFEDVLSSGKPDFPFCFGWANHSWSNKTWIKAKAFQEDTTIFEMVYPGESDWINHFNYCLPAFKDKRYVTVDGKPVFVIWDAAGMPDCQAFMKYWRMLAKNAGFPGIHFIAIRYGKKMSVQQLFDLGFDAVNNSNQYEAEENALGSVFKKKIRSLFVRLSGGALLRKYEYKNIIKNLYSKVDEAENVYPTIISGYDRAARAGRKATIYHNYTPELFEKHARQMVDCVKNKNAEHQIIFLKSWNEWAEGNYIEPDLKYGTAFLDRLKKVIFK